MEPLCDANFPVTMATFDHLTGVRHRDKIEYKAESALEEALNALFFDKERIDTDEVARILSHALRNVTSCYVRLFGNGIRLISRLSKFRMGRRGC